MDDSKEQANVTWRSLLRSSGAAAAFSGMALPNASIVAAGESPHRLGKRFFVEMKLVHKGVPEEPRTRGCGRPGYLTSETDSILTLVSGRHWPDQTRELLVGNGATLFGPHEESFGLKSPSSLAVEKPFQGGNTRGFLVDESYSLDNPSLQLNRQESVTVEIEGRQVEIGVDERSEIELDQKQVTYTPTANEKNEVEVPHPDDPDETITTIVPVKPDPETVTVTPVLTVKVHGRMDVFGGSDVAIIPVNADAPYGQAMARVSSVVDAERKPNDLLVLRNGGGEE